MGKWNRRYYARSRRSKYQDYDWSPPRDEPCPDPETEVWQDNVPMWEKKFCYLVGRMPWKKVLSMKNFMHCHSNVLSWDDSAGEEAFNNAKIRFWKEMNNLPCETQLPNPDMYIDEINWNPYIDPDLVRELDRAYFNPDDKYNLPSCSSKGNNGWPEDADDAWERGYVQSCSVENKASGWNQWDNPVNDTSKLTKNYDPWESHHVQGNEVVKDNTWGDARNKSWDLKPNLSDTSKSWRAEGTTWRDEGTGWHDHGARSRNWNQRTGELSNPSYLNNSYRAQQFGVHQGSRVPNGMGNQWGQKQRDNYSWEVTDSGNMYRGGGKYNAGCRKREGPDHFVSIHKGPRLQGGDYRPSRYGNANDNKRVNFGGPWS